VVDGRYDFGLTERDEARALRLHRESLVIDMLFWGPVGPDSYPDELVAGLQASYDRHRDLDVAWMEAYRAPGRLAARGGLPAYRDLWDATGVTCGHTAIEIADASWVLECAAYLGALLPAHPWLRLARTTDDIRAAHAAGEHAIFLQCQPDIPLSRDLGLIDLAYDVGLRMLQLTYNIQDFVGTGCTDRTGAGLSNFGLEVVRRCNELGVVVDVAHCSAQTALDACAASEVPIVASHTAAKALRDHDRAMTDGELEAIAATGGVVGIVTVPEFLSADGVPGGPGATIDAMLDHVEHAVKVVGVEHVGIGTDWPMCAPEWTLDVVMRQWVLEHGFTEEHDLGLTSTLDGFGDYRDMPNITRGLVARGYTDDDIRAVLGGNVLRVFDAVWH